MLNILAMVGFATIVAGSQAGLGLYLEADPLRWAFQGFVAGAVWYRIFLW